MSKETKKYWEKLLLYYDKKGWFRNGLTLPFIIGSKEILVPGAKLQKVEELLQVFNHSSHYFSVLMCGYIGEYVFRIEQDGKEPSYQHTIDNFIVNDSSLDHIETIEDFISLMEGKYSKQINDRTFSFMDGRWRAYNGEDLNRIKEIKEESYS